MTNVNIELFKRMSPERTIEFIKNLTQTELFGLYPVGQHDEMPGGRTPAFGQQPGGKCHPANYFGTQELSLLR